MSHLKGGRLKEEFYPDWAEYIASYLCEFRKRGFNVWGLTIQNEPNAVQTWDSCVFSPLEERVFLVNYLKPALDAKGLEDVKIY